VLSASNIVTFDDAPPPPGASAWAAGQGPTTEVLVALPDPPWPDQYAALAGIIADTLGATGLTIEHVGSTAVPGLRSRAAPDLPRLAPFASE
jgi:GrpB-like predicted nucleotidyltransferase (UPF0157 family)